MAAKKFANEEERTEFIIKVADYFIENKTSTRKVAKEFAISNITIHEYFMSRLAKIDIERYLNVVKILNDNKPKTKYGSDVETRLNDIYDCIYEKNMTIKNTSEILQISEKTIYNDIWKFDNLRFNNIKKKLKEHSKNNSPFIR